MIKINGNDIIEYEERSCGALAEQFIELKKLPPDTDVAELDEYWEFVEEDMNNEGDYACQMMEARNEDLSD